ncbi:N-formylglutamate amidohydrolase [Aliiruegeria sabulilitoris]|uniref:N-formylglutamate amidohydrolase n=1 Tax=Aliiruegeria sabulilitoris TaxID=1510458 RepID=UPI00082EA7C3|nr:N-formylglutamate amidohydrolase [Aliiruegeria sabulilitoris]NDR57987.1 N-formylglutamate amidohydrolase [Pseudoruegeria sp. M32A2M]
MQNPPFRLELPRSRTTSVVFASPHSGRDYGLDFLRRTVLDELGIRSSEDAFVDRLFDTAPGLGAPLLAATAPRAFVDLNRSADELDPAVVRGVRSQAHNPRIASGLGVIPRVVAGGRVIYRGKIDLEEAQRRLEQVWHPYHAALRQVLAESRAAFGQAILIDCHSMPHEAVRSASGKSYSRPHVVLGDRFGAACTGDIMDSVQAAFERAGLRVSRNTPFAGAFITQHYGRPAHGQNAIQVEIDRSLYMDEGRIVPSKDFPAFRGILRGIIQEITEIGRASPKSLAAE